MASAIDSTSPEDNGALNQGRAPWHAFVPPWLMSLPAFILFAVLVLTPLAMTVVLTFYRFDPASGPIAALFKTCVSFILELLELVYDICGFQYIM